MPHLIDEETGLCMVCQRLKLAAVKESQRFNRPNYNARKESVKKISDKLKKYCNDPSLIRVVSNNYVQYANKDNNYFDFGSEHRTVTVTKRATEKISESPRKLYNEIEETPEYIVEASGKGLTVTQPVYLFPRVNLKELEEQEENDNFDESNKQWIYIEEHKENKKKLMLLDKRFNSAVVMAKAPVVTKSTVIQINDKQYSK